MYWNNMLANDATQKKTWRSAEEIALYLASNNMDRQNMVERTETSEIAGETRSIVATSAYILVAGCNLSNLP